MKIKQIFANQVRLLRTEHGITQQELGNSIGIIKQTVNNWEMGLSIPQADTLCELANYFDVSIDFLFGQTENPKRNR